MKNTITVSVITLTSLAFNGVSFAQVKSPMQAGPAAQAVEKKTEMKSEKAQATVLTGKVTSVDAKAGMLNLKLKDREINLTTDSKSTKAALEKLKVGDTARVFERAGKVIAASPVKAEPRPRLRSETGREWRLMPSRFFSWDAVCTQPAGWRDRRRASRLRLALRLSR